MKDNREVEDLFPSFSLTDLIGVVVKLLGLFAPDVSDHHRRTAYLTARLLEKLGTNRDVKIYGVISASLHDCGMFKVKELNEAHRFTVRGPMPHEEQGYHLLSSFSTLFRCAEIVRYHHMWFNGHDDYGVGKEDVPLQSYVIHLSDRIDVLCRRNVPILVQQDISMMWGNWPYQQRFWKNRGHLQNLKCRS